MDIQCTICGFTEKKAREENLGVARGNTRRYKSEKFPMWMCPQCQSLHSLKPVNFEEIYQDYPPGFRKVDQFARSTYGNLIKRLIAGGLKKDHKILDYGCGNGLFLEILKEKGYENVVGYDPYYAKYDSLPPAQSNFDCVIINDVIEHVDNPKEFLHRCYQLVKPEGMIYVGTADSAGVKDMKSLEPHLMRLHQPFHRVITTHDQLLQLGIHAGMELIATYQRSYMDTLQPFANYRFLDEFNKSHRHVMDDALKPDAAKMLIKKPWLVMYGFLGYFFPCAYEPAALWKKPKSNIKKGFEG